MCVVFCAQEEERRIAWRVEQLQLMKERKQVDADDLQSRLKFLGTVLFYCIWID